MEGKLDMVVRWPLTFLSVFEIFDWDHVNFLISSLCVSEAIAAKQARVDKLYASLKELAGDRRLKLDEVLKLYLLNRDIEDLEQWIAEREVVAGSHELGQDFEHVTVNNAQATTVVPF